MKFYRIELKIIEILVLLLFSIVGAWLCMEKYFIIGILICLNGIFLVVANSFYRWRKSIKVIPCKLEIQKEPLPKKSSNPFKKDKNIGWQINPKTGEVLCDKCLKEDGHAIVLDKDKSGISRVCPRCKTIHILPFGMLSKEDFMENSDIPTANRRPRKKAMRVSTLERSKL